MKVPLTVKNALLVVSVISLVACAGKTPRGPGVVPKSVAIIAVTVAPEVSTEQSQSAMARAMKELIHESGGYRTLRSSEVQRAMDAVKPGSYTSLIQNYARNGVLGPAELSALSAARLPVEMAIIARVEQNTVDKTHSQLEELRSHNGDILSDRKRRILVTKRKVQMQANMINVATGSVFWSRSYSSQPETKLAYVRYFGSSFSGTLAATLVNTMTTGLKDPEWPLPASYQLTVRSLMREVVRNLPR